MNANKNYPNGVKIDITGEICPLTFVKTKLMLEKMERGQTLLVRLNEGEPLTNVPRSVRDLGHTILSIEKEPQLGANGLAVHRVLIRKEAT